MYISVRLMGQISCPADSYICVSCRYAHTHTHHYAHIPLLEIFNWEISLQFHFMPLNDKH